MENGSKTLQTYSQETIFPLKFDDVFLSDICATKCKMELAMNIPGYKSNTFLNHDIATEEVIRATQSKTE